VISRITRAAIATHTNIKEKRTSINKSLYRYRERFKRSTQSDLGLSQSYIRKLDFQSSSLPLSDRTSTTFVLYRDFGSTWCALRVARFNIAYPIVEK